MSILIERPIMVCANIGCTEKLGFFDIKKRKRFCRKCRLDVVEWRCEGCSARISNSRYRETRRFCNDCQGKVRK